MPPQRPLHRFQAAPASLSFGIRTHKQPVRSILQTFSPRDREANQIKRVLAFRIIRPQQSLSQQ